MSRLLFGFFLSFVMMGFTHAEKISLTQGFIAFGQTNPFISGGPVTVYDFNERIPSFEALISDFSGAFNNPDFSGETPFLDPFGSQVTFDPIKINQVYLEDMEFNSTVGHFAFGTNPNYGKGISFENTSWQVEVSPVPEPPIWSLFIIGLIGLALLNKGKERIATAKFSRCS